MSIVVEKNNVVEASQTHEFHQTSSSSSSSSEVRVNFVNDGRV